MTMTDASEKETVEKLADLGYPMHPESIPRYAMLQSILMLAEKVNKLEEALGNRGEK